MLATRYFDKVADHLTNLTMQLESVKEIGEFIADRVLNGKKVYVMDRYNIIDTELVERPSGLALFRSLSGDRNGISEGDILILSAFHPGNQDDLDICNKFRAIGAAVITISPEGPLSQAADRAIINHDDSPDEVITIPGNDNSFCPVSGIVNVTLAWALTAEITAALRKRDVSPSVYRGEYLAESAGKNTEARKRYLSLGY